MNTKKHGKVTMALAMIGGLAALSIAYATISTQLNINSGGDTKVESAAVMFDQDKCEAYGVSYYKDKDDGSGEKELSTCTSAGPQDTSLASNGSVSIKSTNKENDTVEISGTVLKDFGAYAIYKLTIVNKGNTDVKLTKSPESGIDFTNETGKDKLKDNITIKVYDSEGCTNSVGAFGASETATARSQANYILANSSTEWYVKVAHRAHGEEISGLDVSNITGTTEDITSGSFGFTMTPVWENVPSAP